MFKRWLILCVFALPVLGFGQKFPVHPDVAEVRNKGNALLVHLTLGGHFPAGDLADRFGFDQSIGANIHFMTAKNWTIGFNGHYFFGNQVNEDPLAILRTPEGDIIGNDRLLASVVLKERGWYWGGEVGKLFAFKQTRSGIRFTVGGGWTQHKIRVQDDNNSLTQITGDYTKGYDRFCSGFTATQFLGYQMMSKNRRINFFAGFEVLEAFTVNRREWDFSEQRKLDEKRNDMRVGFRVGWALPFYFEGNAEHIYY